MVSPEYDMEDILAELNIPDGVLWIATLLFRGKEVSVSSAVQTLTPPPSHKEQHY